MRIEGIQIDGFGCFAERELGPLGDVTVIHGPNGAGKSTLHAFIRAVLFGFPAAGSPGWIPALSGGRHGGRLVLRDARGERVVVERHSDACEGAARVTRGGEVGDERALRELLGGVTADVYQSVFAFGIDDLQPLAALPVDPRHGQLAVEPHAADVESLRQRIAGLEDERAAAREHLENARAELARGAAALAAPVDSNGAEHAVDARLLRLRIDELRETWTRLQATRRMMEVYQQTVVRQSIQSETLFLGVLMAGTLTPLVIGALIGQQVVIALGAASAALGTLSLVLAISARSRFDTAQAQARFQLEITHREAEARYFHAALVAGIDAADVHTGLARMEAELAALEASHAERRELEARLAGLRERCEQAADELAAIERELADANDALAHAARRASERGSLPAVLRAASDAFDAMTLGAYHRLVLPDGQADIVAIARDGLCVPLESLSRGAREQAYLALRIGLIRELGARARALPVLLDDVLVTFDPARATEAMRALNALAADHQILLFTCHPATVALARFINPAARVIALDQQRVTSFDPIWLDND